MDNNKYKSLPPEEEMRTFLKIGRRLHILDYSYWELKSEPAYYGYKNINAVVTLAFFIEWLYLQKNVQAMNGFIAEMNAMSDDSLREYVVDKALDYFKECAENANNNFSRAMVESNWEHVLKERNSNKRCVGDQYWPVMGKHYLKSWWENNLDYKNIIHVQFDKVLGTRKIVYFHGFGSSCFGSTVKSLQELLPDFTIIAEDIAVDPMKALPVLKAKCELEQPKLVVGTSMGGMYAQQMRGFKRICINPAFDLSKHKDILHEGTFEFLNPRRNGETTFTITPEIISHFEEMEAHQFDGITVDDRENVYGLFADNDTTVNCEDIFRKHYKHIMHFHGEHRLNRQVIEEVLVPLIKEWI